MAHKLQHIQKLLEDRYYLRDEEGNLLETDPSEMYERVAKEVAKAELNYTDNEYKYMGWRKKFFDLMNDNKFLPNTPLLANAGKKNHGSYSACFYIPVEDSMEGIFDAVKQAAIISKSGGGVGFNFSSLRPKGSIVKSTGHKASGPVSFMRVFNTMCDTVSQGGVRRGAMIALLSIDHPDILEFISCKDDGVSFTNFNISVAVTDKFMEAVGADEVWHWKLDNGYERTCDARWIWNKICEHAWMTGDPGLVFIDRMREDDELINGCNPCLVGNTILEDSGGLRRISDGDGSLYTAWKTGKKETIKLKLSNGQELVCTPDHMIKTSTGFVEAKDTVGKYILTGAYISDRKVIPCQDERFVLAGFLFGESYICGNGGGLSVKLNPDREPEVGHLLESHGFKRQNSGAYYQKLTDVFAHEWYGTKCEDKRLPDYILQDYNMSATFLRGLFEANGSVHSGRVSYKTTSKVLAQDIQIVLQALGIRSYITTNKPKRVKFDNGTYECRESYDLNIGDMHSISRFTTMIGFYSSIKEDKLNDIDRQEGLTPYPTVKEIVPNGVQDVYDFSMRSGVPENVANGIVVHNCGEIGLRDFESCNLGSINLLRYVTPTSSKGYKVTDDRYLADTYAFDFELLKQDIPTMVHFLDNVIDVNTFPLPEIEEATKNTRKIGLGVMGWADALIKLKIPYDSDEAINLAEKIMMLIKENAESATIELRRERGSSIPTQESKLSLKRNYSLLCVAPTGTISRIAGVSSGIEPVYAWGTHHKLENHEYDEEHWAYKELMEQHDPKNNTYAYYPDYMKTALEIAPEWHLKHQATFQKYIDNSVSKTVNLPTNATVVDIQDIYYSAWDLDCKGITIYRNDSREGQPLNKIENKMDTFTASSEQLAPAVEALKMGSSIKISDREYRKRGPVAIGATHKLETTTGKTYITVNYDRDQQEPNEVFIHLGNSATPRELSLAEWAGRLLSICLKHNVPVEDIQRQSNKIYSDATFIYDSRIFNSLPQAVSHLIGKSFDQYLENVGLEDTYAPQPVFEPAFTLSEENCTEDLKDYLIECRESSQNGEYCYNCGGYTMINQGGCMCCTNCGFEKCS
jgi:ribonucleoside-diphosphate reductase alpha chain